MTFSRLLRLFLLASLMSLTCVGHAQRTAHPAWVYGKEKGFTAENVMVVSDHPEATRIGVEILSQGGSAIDAAVAVHFALAVCYPYAGSIAGGGFMVLRTESGEVNTLDFRETAPAAATETMYQDTSGNVIKDLSWKGHKAVAVPGMVAGMVEAHAKYGKLTWVSLVQPSVDLARKGFPITAKQAEQFNEQATDFQTYNPGTTYLNKQNGWKEGDTLNQPDLALCLERIRDRQRMGFYDGETAKLLLAEMKKGGGLISREDLMNYKPLWRAPLTGKYHSFTIHTMGPPSSGGIILLQLLRMTERFPLDRWGFHDVRSIHVIAEAERRAFADRATHLGDPAFWAVPVAALLDSNYLDSRMKDVDPYGKVTPSSEIHSGIRAIESDETTHYSIIDSSGNAVSVTTTINGPYGSKVFVAGGGFLLNNEMDDFSSAPGVPNAYGVIGGDANAIRPMKRPLSSMTPCIIMKDSTLFMVVGSPGGSTIPTSVFQTFTNVIRYHMTMQEAVEASRFHHQWLPDQIFMEEGAFSKGTIKDLRGKGHVLKTREPIGDVLGIRVYPWGEMEAGTDPRRDAKADGW